MCSGSDEEGALLREGLYEISVGGTMMALECGVEAKVAVAVKVKRCGRKRPR